MMYKIVLLRGVCKHQTHKQTLATTTVLDTQTQNGDEPVGEYSFPGQSCLSSADSC